MEQYLRIRRQELPLRDGPPDLPGEPLPAGILVEAELGAVLGHETGPMPSYEEIFEKKIGFTKPEEAARFVRFVKETGGPRESTPERCQKVQNRDFLLSLSFNGPFWQNFIQYSRQFYSNRFPEFPVTGECFSNTGWSDRHLKSSSLEFGGTAKNFLRIEKFRRLYL